MGSSRNGRLATPFYPIGGYSAPMHARFSVIVGGLLTLLLAPAVAQAAPTLEPLKPCYVTAGTANNPQGEPVLLRAAGFTPTSRVDLTLDGTLVGQGLQVDAQGILAVPEFPAPFVGKGTREFTVTLTEQGNPANTVTATASTSALGVKVKPRQARPSERIRFTGLGFTADKPVYAHYTKRGKQRARVRLVRSPGDCGAWSVRRPQFPIDDPSRGKWIVQFDQSKRYINGTTGRLRSVFVRLQIDIKLVPN